jgi:hypothetical protein
MNTISAYKETTDNWFPSFKFVGNQNRNFVNVEFTKIEPNTLTTGIDAWRVCAWGNDDFGLELDYTDRIEALNMFYAIITLEYVNVDILCGYGFKSA